MTVFVEVPVARHSRENASHLQGRLERLPGCVACHMVSGEADFLVEMVVPDLVAYEAILTSHLLTMTEVATVRSNFSLRPILTNGQLQLPDWNLAATDVVGCGIHTGAREGECPQPAS